MFFGCVVDSATPQNAFPLPEYVDPEEAQVDLRRAVLVGGKEGVDTLVYLSVEEGPRVAISALRANERPLDDFDIPVDLSLPYEVSVEGPGTVHLSGFLQTQEDQGEEEEESFDGKFFKRRASSSTSEGESEVAGSDSEEEGVKPSKLAAGEKKSFATQNDDASSGSDAEEIAASQNARPAPAPGKKIGGKNTLTKAMVDECAEEEEDEEEDGCGDDDDDDNDDSEAAAADSSADEKLNKHKGAVATTYHKQQQKKAVTTTPSTTHGADKKKRPAPAESQPTPPAKKEKKVEFSTPSSTGAETQLKETVVSYLKKNGACTVGQLGAKVPKPPVLKNVKWGQFLKKFSCFKVDGQNVTLVN